MPRSKQFAGRSKKEKAKAREPRTATEFQEAGVDLEESAERWRAGDKAKSLRFYGRTLQIYTIGLDKFPCSFDLAYNKARVQLLVATQFDQGALTLSLLREAWDTHRHAFDLDPANMELLYNMGENATAIGEEIANTIEDGDTSPEAEALQEEALSALKEGMDLYTRCLRRQEDELEKQDSADQESSGSPMEGISDDVSSLKIDEGPKAVGSTGDEMDVTPDAGTNASDSQEEFVTMMEPVTVDTLLDTIGRQINLLTTIGKLVSTASQLNTRHLHAWIRAQRDFLMTKITCLSPQAKESSFLELRSLLPHLTYWTAEIEYRSGSIDARRFKSEMDHAFRPEDEAQDVQAWRDKATFLKDFRTAVRETEGNERTRIGLSQEWNVLTTAVSLNNKLAKVGSKSPRRVAEAYMQCGDASMALTTLGTMPQASETARKAMVHNARNAAVFYRNAFKMYSSWAGTNSELAQTAEIARIVAEGLKQCAEAEGSSKSAETVQITRHAVQKELLAIEWEEEFIWAVVGGLKDEGCIPERWLG